MKMVHWMSLSLEKRAQLLKRPSLTQDNAIAQSVTDIIERVRRQGDKALLALTETFDKVTFTEFSDCVISPVELARAEQRLSPDVKAALATAKANIHRFHAAQRRTDEPIETSSGVVCQLLTRPIASVGLYVPGGTAPLPSTVLMLAIPAKLANCPQILLCSPPPIADEILYAAKLCGVERIFALGGAQAIAAMALGNTGVPKVDKIFGPGNAYVTEAKRQLSALVDGVAMDMPAGPSEVLVIADNTANPRFIAADLLSQAEHGADSQVVLVSTNEALLRSVKAAMLEQLTHLPRADIARQALRHSLLIFVPTEQMAVEISNAYAPEHLLIQTRAPEALLTQIVNAGSVFLGHYSPESVGDYASGTNHVLPTYGFAKTYSSLTLSDFSKRMTVQKLSQQGLKLIAPSVVTLAKAEGLEAHANAVTLRLNEKAALPEASCDKSSALTDAK